MDSLGWFGVAIFFPASNSPGLTSRPEDSDAENAFFIAACMEADNRGNIITV